MTDFEEFYNIEEVYCAPDLGREDGTTVEANNPSKTSLPPDKSKFRYEYMYECFNKWKKENHLEDLFSEDIILWYFRDLSKTKSPSTLWCTYSMLKAMIKFNHNIDIGTYTEVLKFLKELGKGYVAVTAPTFTDEQIEKFMNEAPDSEYLVTKVALIFGLLGSLSTDELTNLKDQNVETHGRIYLVKIPKPDQPSITRSFTISDGYFDIVEKYRKLRPPNAQTDRFFLSYRRQKCTVQVIGKTKMAGMSREVAMFLELENAHLFTGHSLRKTSLTKSGQHYRKTKKHKLQSTISLDNKKRDTSNEAEKSQDQQHPHETYDEDNSSSASCSHSNDIDFVQPPNLPAGSATSSTVETTQTTVIRDQNEVVMNFPMSVLCENEDEDECGNRESTEADGNLRDRRKDFINKYFTFKNCNNIYINFE